MRIEDIYTTAIEWGLKMDPRGRKLIEQQLEEVKREYEELKEKDKELFDKERLRNPYVDTRVLYGDGGKEVEGILAGVDMETGEVLLADRLRERGREVDLILSHHPEGRAFANFYEVMDMQADILNKFGVPINVAESLLEERKKEVERRVLPLNHTRAVDAARLLDLPLMCIHTPADNGVAHYLQGLFDREKPLRLKDLLDILCDIPEYQEARKNNSGPRLISGSKESRVGKVLVDMTGGTEGPREVLENLVQSGVSTIVGMHMGEEHLKEAKKHHLNVVIAGHISSDNLGLNLFLDHLLKEKGPCEIMCCSGFKRVER